MPFPFLPPAQLRLAVKLFHKPVIKSNIYLYDCQWVVLADHIGVVIRAVNETVPFMPLKCYERRVSTISYTSILFLEGYLQGLFLDRLIHLLSYRLAAATGFGCLSL